MEDFTRDILSMSMEELYDEAIKRNWTLEALQSWSIFKLAQYVEKIAYIDLPELQRAWRGDELRKGE